MTITFSLQESEFIDMIFKKIKEFNFRVYNDKANYDQLREALKLAHDNYELIINSPGDHEVMNCILYHLDKLEKENNT